MTNNIDTGVAASGIGHSECDDSARLPDRRHHHPARSSAAAVTQTPVPGHLTKHY